MSPILPTGPLRTTLPPTQAGTVKSKGSHARNLDRLKNGLLFTVLMIEQLMEDPAK